MLGICSNLDQVLTMARIEEAGAGAFFRAGEITPGKLRAKLRELLTTPSYRMRARALQREIAEYSPTQRLPMLLNRLLTPSTAAQA